MIGAITPVYNDEAIVGAAIKCFKPFVDKYIALISEKPYYGEPQPPDKTEEICCELGVDVVKWDWRYDHIQRNRGLELCSDCDWIFNIDADELMEAKEIGKLIEFAETSDAEAIAVFPEVYWRDIDHVLRPLPTFTPVILTRPNVRFHSVRNVDCEYIICDAQMHHIAWCEPKDIYKKILTYVHANECKDAKNWYENHYKNWCEGRKAIDPMGNEFNVERKSLPKELREKLGVE